MKKIVSSLVASIVLVSALNAADFYASVDGENITKKDITMVLQDPRIDFDKLPDTAKKQVLEQIVNRKLLSNLIKYFLLPSSSGISIFLSISFFICLDISELAFPSKICFLRSLWPLITLDFS